MHNTTPGPRHDDGDVLRRKHSGRRQTLRSWQVNADAEYHEQGDEVSEEKSGSGCALFQLALTRTEIASENLNPAESSIGGQEQK